MSGKRILFIGILMLLAFTVAGCNSKNYDAKQDLKKELQKLKEGKADISTDILWESLGIKVSKSEAQYLDETLQECMEGIYQELEFEIEKIEAAENSAYAKISVHGYDIGRALSQDAFMTQVLLYLDEEIENNPDLNNEDAQKNVVAYLTNFIADSHFTFDGEMEVFMTYADGEYEISYTEEILRKLWNMDDGYIMRMSDIHLSTKDSSMNGAYENYDETRVLNLPRNNKTTISSPTNPIKPGNYGILDNLDYFYSEKRYMVRAGISDIIRGDEALSLIQSLAIENESPSHGMEYILIKVSIECLENGTGNSAISFSMDDFSMLTENGEYLDNKIIFGLDEPMPISKNEETNVYVAFEIPEQMNGFVILSSYMDTALCFSIN